MTAMIAMTATNPVIGIIWYSCGSDVKHFSDAIDLRTAYYGD